MLILLQMSFKRLSCLKISKARNYIARHWFYNIFKNEFLQRIQETLSWSLMKLKTRTRYRAPLIIRSLFEFKADDIREPQCIWNT
jgi:hypothetical protein